jgi:hypothetical protein
MSEPEEAQTPRTWGAADSALDMYPSAQSLSNSAFRVYTNVVDFGSFCSALPEGTGMAVRVNSSVSTLPGTWDYATIIKSRTPCEWFATYEYGRTETVDVGALAALVHDGDIQFAFPNPRSLSNLASVTAVSSCENYVVLSHGYSPEVGPNYRFLKSVEAAIKGTSHSSNKHSQHRSIL